MRQPINHTKSPLQVLWHKKYLYLCYWTPIEAPPFVAFASLWQPGIISVFSGSQPLESCDISAPVPGHALNGQIFKQFEANESLIKWPDNKRVEYIFIRYDTMCRETMNGAKAHTQPAKNQVGWRVVTYVSCKCYSFSLFFCFFVFRRQLISQVRWELSKHSVLWLFSAVEIHQKLVGTKAGSMLLFAG